MRPSFVRDHGKLRGCAKPFDVCTRELAQAATELFGMDPEVVSVGIVALPGGFGFGVRLCRGFGDAPKHPPQNASRPGGPPGPTCDPSGRQSGSSFGDASVVPLHRCDRVATIRGVPLVIDELHAPIVPLLELPSAAANGPALASLPEQRRQRPLRPGLQLQNWDEDARAGLLTSERITVGTLGMVLAHDDGALLLSNNHVLAGQNRGCVGDRIAQPGGVQIGEAEVVARLERFVPLQVSPIGARPGRGVIWNHVDAAVARLRAGVDWRASFLDVHALPSPSRYGGPVLGERVFKVGRTTGLRWGVITSVGVRVGPIPYAIGGCWFRGSFMIEGEGGRPFSDGGDSGAIVVRRSGEVIGMVYAGNGAETLACPISDVLAAIV